MHGPFSKILEGPGPPGPRIDAPGEMEPVTGHRVNVLAWPGRVGSAQVSG